MNKADLLPGDHVMQPQQGRVWVSALTGQGLADLLKAIDERLVFDPLIEATFRLPQSAGRALAALEGGAVIRRKHFEGNRVLLSVRGPASLLNRYRRYQVEEASWKTVESGVN
jgi:GTP-binding protein HflX